VEPTRTRLRAGITQGGWAMRRRRTNWLLAILGALLVVVLGATTAAAQGPEREVFPVSFTEPFDLLTEACGVPVTINVSGTFTVLTFPDGTGPVELDAVSIDLVFVAGDNQVLTRNAGIDLFRVEPDGTAILTSTGVIGVIFSGVLKINLTTGEVTLESPQHSEGSIARVCQRLTR
jgi:hypothetical protein